MNVRLELVHSEQPQTTWWKPTPDYEIDAWWVVVNGQRVRHASIVEVDLWQQLQRLEGHV